MGLTDWFRAARALAPPADLRGALIDAVEAKDTRAVSGLFSSYRDTIRASFTEWSTVPLDMRADERALASYAEMLITVARLFEQAGDDGPMAALRGDPVANPIEDWNEQIATAQQLSEQDRHADAAAVLAALLAAMQGVRGSAIDFYRPRVLGKLGVALYQAGDAAGALAMTCQARDFCGEIGDEEGVAAYSANLRAMGGE